MEETNPEMEVNTEVHEVKDTFDYGDGGNASGENEDETGDNDGDSKPTPEPEPEPAPRFKVKVSGEELEVELEELLNGYSRNADYTKKSQEVAETRRALEARQEQINQQAQLQQESIQEIAQLHSIDAQLAEFAKINWDAESQNDPVATQQLFIRQQNLRDARAGLIQSVQQKESQTQQIKNQQVFEAQQATAKQLEEGRAMLAREIKDWSPQLATTLIQFAVNDGWTKAQIDAITPAQVKSLHRAYVGHQLIQKQSAVPPVKPPPPPVPKVSAGGSAAGRRIADLPMEEYAKARRKQRN